MKRTLSLILAVLMIASLAVSAGAATTLEELLRVSRHIYDADTKAVWSYWPDECPTKGCSGTAWYIVNKAGEVEWSCSTCGKSGIVEKFNEDFSEKGETKKKEDPKAVIDTVKCTECGKTGGVVFIMKLEAGAYLYKCEKCGSYFVAKEYYSEKVYEDYEGDISCGHPNCSKKAKFDTFVTENGKLYARYVCANGHETLVYVGTGKPEKEIQKGYYLLTLRGSYGGSVTTGDTVIVKSGEKRVIDFEAYKGYSLTSITVNGKEVAPASSIELKITENTVVYATFTKTSELKNYTLKASAVGNGTVTVTKNGTKADPAKLTANAADSVVYKFVPSSYNMKVKDVTVNGKSKGSITSYTVSKLSDDLTIKVTFAWNSPYYDVKDDSVYAAAVEYVTEYGIMKELYKNGAKKYFSGTKAITVETVIDAFAEMADTSDKLSTTEERVEWAVKKGLISKNADLTVKCDVQTICALIKDYLGIIASDNKVTFTNLSDKDSVVETAVKLKFVTEKTYNTNRNLNRYDLAAVCRLIASLEYKKK